MKIPRNVPLGLIYAGAVAAAVAATVWLGLFVWEKDRQLAQVRGVLEASPDRHVRFADLKTEITKRQLDVQRVEAFLLARDEIGNLITTIEQEAQRYGVAVSVPDVTQKKVFDENGVEIVPTGPLVDVALHITASGDPEDLIRFVHGVEHLSYLLYFDEWEVQATSEGSGFDRRAAPGGRQAGSAANGQLDSTLVVAVWQEERAALP